jgi:hypothetical protein
MRALRILAALLCVLLLAVPGLVLVKAATAPAFRWSGVAGECPIVPGSEDTRCLNLVQTATLASVAAGSALGLVGLARGRAVLVRAGALTLAGGTAGTFLYRAAAGLLGADDVRVSLLLLTVAGALLLAGRTLPRPAPPAAPA